MNFKQRLTRFAIGLGIGTLLSMWMLGSRGCTDWLPAQRVRTDIQFAGIQLSDGFRCVMKCKGLSDQISAAESLLLAADLDWDASSPRSTPKRYVFHVGDSLDLDLIFDLTDSAAVALADEATLTACGCR